MAKRSNKKGLLETAPSQPAEPGEFLPIPIKSFFWLQVLAIVGAVLWIYWPVLHGDWLWDDDVYITNNPLLHSLLGLAKIWFVPGSMVDYYPLGASVLWIQWQLFGLNTIGYHLTSVVLHIINALLVWRLFNKFGLRLAWWGGLLFAIHPVQVESVAWISEIKNTLSLPPFLLAMCAYIDFDERRQWRDYLLAVGLFLVAMLCKVTMASFPFLILLYAWWKRGRIEWSDLKLSAPFFVISLTLGVINSTHTHYTAQEADLVSQLAMTGLVIMFYLSEFFLPLGFLPIYQPWEIEPITLILFLPWPVMFGLFYLCWVKRGSWGRHVLLALGFFLLNLGPVIGFIILHYGTMVWSLDHLVYLPLIGLVGLSVALFERVDDRFSKPARLGGFGLLTLVTFLLICESRGYAGLYINQQTLWSYTLRHNPQAWKAHNNLGNALLEAGHLSEAMEQYRQATTLNPNYSDAPENMGLALLKSGHLSEAIEQFEQALKIMPNDAEAHYNMGYALNQAGRVPEAINQYEQALKLNPNYVEAYDGLGIALKKTGHPVEASEQYLQALKINPDLAEVHYNLGNALIQMGRVQDAIEQFEDAVKIQPGYTEAHYNLAKALVQTGQDAEAIIQYQQALKDKSDDAEGHYNLANAFLRTGQADEAIGEYGQVLRIKPDYAEAHNNLGIALSQSGRMPEAIEQFELALKIKPDYAGARNNLAKAQGVQNLPSSKK